MAGALRRGTALLIAFAVGSVLLASAAAAPARASDYTVIYNLPAGVAAGETVRPIPPGANDWACRPTARHRDPVVLVPGLRGDSGWDFQATAPLLANHGYCVFAFDYREQGRAAIETVAAGLSDFVDRVLAATGARNVDVVGHSQGGMVPRYYLKFLGGAAKVDALVGVSPLNHGTTLAGVAALLGQVPPVASAIAEACPACAEQAADSEFMKKLNTGGDTVPGVRYTVIGTRYEEVITPYQAQFLTGPRVTNILLQEQCPTDAVDHLASIYDSVALHDVLNALDPARATPPTCTVVLPGVGG
jgi:triacylglycerol esterase/lipase EstA (alpha/beta hydrolase family)